MSLLFSPPDYFWLIGLGLGVGLYGALIGAGGGLMLVLLLLYPKMLPEHLTAISFVEFRSAGTGRSFQRPRPFATLRVKKKRFKIDSRVGMGL